MDRPQLTPLFNEQLLCTALGKQLRDDITKFLRSRLSADISPREFGALAHTAVERVVQQAISKR
jgi:hypothetical protein